MKLTRRTLLFLAFFSSFLTFAQVDHWEQVVDAHDIWKYRLGNSEPDPAWKTLGFNDAAWLSGPGSIGYGTNDDSTIINPVPSLYMRREFQISQLSDVEALLFHADFDDAFVAYLNGVEIARSNIDTLQPKYNTPPNMSRNATTYNGAATFQGGQPGAWIIQDTLWQGLLQAGTNVLAVHTLDSTLTWDMTTKYWLHVGMAVPGVVHGPAANWLNFDLFESPVGIIRINTYGKDVSSSGRMRGTMAIVWDPAGGMNPSYASANDVLTNIMIKKRGQYSLYNFPKNGYSIESQDAVWEDDNISPMGLPKEEDWILHGPYADRTFMRNALAYHLAREAGRYASRTRYVELFLNGEYEGVYVLLERIKRDNDRVDIAKLNPDEISGDDVTGGYIWRRDWGTADWFSNFNTKDGSAPVEYQYLVPKPEDIVVHQEVYLQDAVDRFEQSLQNTTVPYLGKFWDDYIDVGSFVDYFLMTELTKNIDGYRASMYFHKDKDSKGGKVVAGPVWDFNFSLGLTSSCFGYETQGWVWNGYCDALSPNWWTLLVQTPEFADAVNCRWQELTSSSWHVDTIFDFIQEQESVLSALADRNHARWPLAPGTVPPQVWVIDSTYAGDVDIMRQWLIGRMAWLDANMIGVNCQVDVAEETLEDLRIYPNPAAGRVYIRTEGSFDQVVVRTATGQEVYRARIAPGDHFAEPIEMELGHLAEGLYTCELIGPSGARVEKLLVAR